MEWLNELAEWAWARHHNELSWYIRPLFLLPFAMSMAWFPAPEHPSAGAIEMLAAEREYLLGEWGRRSRGWALVAINGGGLLYGLLRTHLDRSALGNWPSSSAPAAGRPALGDRPHLARPDTGDRLPRGGADRSCRHLPGGGRDAAGGARARSRG